MTSNRPSNARLEVCIASLDDAIAAAAGGAHRLELNAALALGGLTPAMGLLNAVLQQVALPVVAMVRPRSGGFCYSENDFSVMLADAAAFARAGAAGAAFGCLEEDGRVDIRRCRSMLAAIDGREAVFHRAFDLTPDPFTALEQLIDLGVTRVMTSGQRRTALEGGELIAKLIAQAAGRIEVLPAGGIRPHNVGELMRMTGCMQVHASLRSERDDPSGRLNAQVRFSVEQNRADDVYDATDQEQVAAMVAGLNGAVTEKS